MAKKLTYKELEQKVRKLEKRVVTYSQADTVKVSLRLVEDRIELTIEDNGKGFDLAGVQAMEFPKRGVGLESIKERTIIFGGSLDIRTAPGQGTTIRVSWPC